MATHLPRKDLFDLPPGLIYLDGNSLGPLPKTVRKRVQHVVDVEWGQRLIRSWNDSGWMAQPLRVGDRLARLLGAPEGSIVVGDTLSTKVFQALAAALHLRPDRRTVLSDAGNFPSDLYVAQGLMGALDRGHTLEAVAPEAVYEAIGPDTAAVLLTEVDYRTGRKHDMHRISTRAEDQGAIMIWDLAHSAGAVEVDLARSGAPFAVGCTYKYLNGGPGAPAFIYVRPDLIERVQPALTGWMGHRAPFAFEPNYEPATSIERLRVGTPPVLQMTALEEALSVWDDVAMADVRAQSIVLSQRFIAEVERRCPELRLASPRAPQDRGSQVSFACKDGYAIVQALIARGVIGDFRAPDLMRFGFTPLYVDEADVVRAVDILEDVLTTEQWRQPKYQVRQRVT